MGRRLREAGEGSHLGLSPGDYVFWSGIWWARTPNGHLCNLIKHQVTEHANGSISVSPSIRVSDMYHRELYHGFIRDGQWVDA